MFTLGKRNSRRVRRSIFSPAGSGRSDTDTQMFCKLLARLSDGGAHQKCADTLVQSPAKIADSATLRHAVCVCNGEGDFLKWGRLLLLPSV